jgi:hypothetical protein
VETMSRSAGLYLTALGIVSTDSHYQPPDLGMSTPLDHFRYQPSSHPRWSNNLSPKSPAQFV